MEEGLFPSRRSIEEDGDTEEERRLCYVAITRAKENLFITNTKKRDIPREVSLFTLRKRLGPFAYLIKPVQRTKRRCAKGLIYIHFLRRKEYEDRKIV